MWLTQWLGSSWARVRARRGVGQIRDGPRDHPARGARRASAVRPPEIQADSDTGRGPASRAESGPGRSGSEHVPGGSARAAAVPAGARPGRPLPTAGSGSLAA